MTRYTKHTQERRDLGAHKADRVSLVLCALVTAVPIIIAAHTIVLLISNNF